jgi:putative transposase
VQCLGVVHSRSRPVVSNDNPYSEALFHILKYRPQFPVEPFADLLHARRWVTELMHWYNEQHRHSTINFVTSTQRYAGLGQALLDQRAHVYAAARAANPHRWSGEIRDWSRVDEVHLNPNIPKPQEADTPKEVA